MTQPPHPFYKWRRRRLYVAAQMAAIGILSALMPGTVLGGAIRQRHHDHATEEEKKALNDTPAFFRWVQDALNINTELVELKTFSYYNYIHAMKDRIDVFYEEETQYYNSFHQRDLGENEDDDDDDDRFLSILQYPTISTRGLAAARDIEIGQIILQIPHDALWTVSNRIDKDTVLSQVMGLEIRLKHGWNSQVDEIPLLAVALLYHFQLFRHAEEEQEESPFWAYLQLLDETNVQDQIPHLWGSKTLRHSATVGVRKVAKGIQKDVKELYQRIVVPLIQEYPDTFGNHNIDDIADDDKHQDQYTDEEWMFSLERFHWAFALVNSRHWHLPIPDEKGGIAGDVDEMEEAVDSTDSNIQFDENASPPASMPTEEWMDLQQQLEHRRDEESPENVNDIYEGNDWPVGNSFLAPVADMLNFGPPCTRGVYNTTTHTFDIVATCNIPEGQEITFWYADACQDVFMANYGFTLPTMVPTCEPYYDDYMSNAGFALRLERELLLTLDELDMLDLEMDHLVDSLEACHCDKLDHNETLFKRDSVSSPVSPEARVDQPKRTSKKASNHARHAIRGANNKAPAPRKSNGRSDGLSRSQKRTRRVAASSRDL
jgi:hypothetical protein